MTRSQSDAAQEIRCTYDDIDGIGSEFNRTVDSGMIKSLLVHEILMKAKAEMRLSQDGIKSTSVHSI